ncbi:MAG TPA: AbrB/MazE/SpoVT family DNA-binding domain-containing protein [Rhizomicrobium sp.]|jgi:putative addiction module antidote|nr:AbrB/MazE/SpoVT family DNA-binding domain-containing protein [Rhizomicrobium sp.]
MHFSLKIIQIGNSLGVTLPKEALAALKVEKGDTLTLTPAPDGFRVTPYDPEVDQQVDAGRQIMREYRDTLRALAK